MATLVNQYYTGVYDPALASGIDINAGDPYKAVFTYHDGHQPACNVTQYKPFTYSKSMMREDGKPQEIPTFYGRQKPSDAFVKKLLLKGELARQQEYSEAQKIPIKQGRKLDQLMYDYFKNKWIEQTENKEHLCEANLLSDAKGSAHELNPDGSIKDTSLRDQYLQREFERQQARGNMAYNNPSVRKRIQQQMEWEEYFKQSNPTYAATARSMGYLEGRYDRVMAGYEGDRTGIPITVESGLTAEEERIKRMGKSRDDLDTGGGEGTSSETEDKPTEEATEDKPTEETTEDKPAGDTPGKTPTKSPEKNI